VRDKIAASKRRGIWVGGPVPLGYASISKKLVVMPEDAETVRAIFARYLKLGSIGPLAEELDRSGIRTKQRRVRFGVGRSPISSRTESTSGRSSTQATARPVQGGGVSGCELRLGGLEHVTIKYRLVLRVRDHTTGAGTYRSLISIGGVTVAAERECRPALAQAKAFEGQGPLHKDPRRWPAWSEGPAN
jgi:hypothetical protein